MQIGQEEDSACQTEKGGCCGLSAVEDARRVAECLDIPYYVMNFKREFKQNVMDYFVEEYLQGRTPNPCIACNRYVKWEALLKRSLEIGADYIATGHYARIDRLPNNRFAIRNSVTAAKDQTYALYNLTQEQLAHTLMPVGDYTKEEIRQLADNSRVAAGDIQTVSKLVTQAVEKLSTNAQNMLQFVDKDVMADYDGFVEIVNRYEKDADTMRVIFNEFATKAADMAVDMQQMSDGIRDITSTVEEGANGVSHAAEDTAALADSMVQIKEESNENQRIYEDLKREVSRFEKV